MTYTEIQEKNGRKHYYRTKSIKINKKVKKERIYMGVDLKKEELYKKEIDADKELKVLSLILSQEELKQLEIIKKDFSKEPRENYENRYENFCALFTYDSTGIEGNTLTFEDTSFLLFESIVPKNKSLREINETLHHKKAFDYLLNYQQDINKELILELHRLMVGNTLKQDLVPQIGRYRTVQVYIGMSLLPKPSEVPEKMASLLRWYSNNKNKLHPIILASYFHTEFEKIHPFVDGNGRVGRLLMNFILHKNKFPMVNIPQTKRKQYYQALREQHYKNNLKPFINLLMGILKNAVLRF